MLPDNLHIGPIPIHWFGIFLALSLLVAGMVLSREFRRSALSSDQGWETIVWGAIGGLIGARLWVIGEQWGTFLESPVRFAFSSGGLAWYGGLAGGTLAATLYFRRQSIPWLTGADATAPSLAIGQAIGRIGCQVSGDGDWGQETTLPWGMAYPNAVVGWDKPPGVLVHPTPIYEFVAYAAVFLYLLKLRGRAPAPGTSFGSYLVLVGIARFLVEFVRINPRVVAGLTLAQIVSTLVVVIGVWLIARARRPTPKLITAQ